MRIIGPAILVVAVGVVLLRAVSTQADGSTPQGLPSDHSTASTTLTILTAGAPHVVPEGGARTGGGSTAPNRPAPTAAVGTAMLASGLGLVALTLRRRAARR